MAQAVPWASIESEQLDAGLLPLFPMEAELTAGTKICGSDGTPLTAVTFVRRPSWSECPSGRLVFHVCPVCGRWMLAEGEAEMPVVQFQGQPYRLRRRAS